MAKEVIVPVVRYLILCEDILTDPRNRRRVSLVNLISAIRSTEQPPFPLNFPELCVFVQLTECRRRGWVRIEICRADTGALIRRTQDRPIPAGADPLEVLGVRFRIEACVFPEPALYWVQFWYNDRMIAQQPILLR